MRQVWLGRKHKPESLAKIGAASSGRTHTAEYKAMMRSKMLGRKLSRDTRHKISQNVLQTHRRASAREVRVSYWPKGRSNMSLRSACAQEHYLNIKRGKFYIDQAIIERERRPVLLEVAAETNRHPIPTRARPRQRRRAQDSDAPPAQASDQRGPG